MTRSASPWSCASLIRKITALAKLLKRPSSCDGDDVLEIPRAYCVLDRLEQCVLADALRSAEHEGVIDLFLRALHPVRQPRDDVAGVVGIDLVGVLKPGAGLASIARHNSRRPIVIEASHLRALDPAAGDDQAILDQHRKARAPGHLLHCAVAIEPGRRGEGDGLAVLVAGRFAGLGQHRYPRQNRALTLVPVHISRHGVKM